MIRSFLAVVSVALFTPVAFGQFAYPLPTASTCANGQCRPVQAVTGAVHAAVTAGGETFRHHLPAFHQPATTFVPGQPVRNVLRAVKGFVTGR